MTTQINHLYEATIEGITHTIDEARTDTYNESSGSCSYHVTYHLQADTPISITTARTLFNLWVRLAHRMKWNGLPITSQNISHPEEEDLDKFWVIELEYSGEADTDFEKYKVPYELNESFSTGGGTSHITQCWYTDATNTGETVYQVNANDPGPSTFNGQIGWNGQQAEGCDVIRPAFSFSLHRKVTEAEMTTTYRQTLCLTTGCVNSTAFCGFSPGNLLLESVSGNATAEYKEDDIQIDEVTGEITWPPRIYYDITFTFRGGLEFTNFNVGGATVQSKKSHQFLWVYYERKDDTAVGVTLDTPKTVVVNDVYPSADFAVLNIYGEQDNNQEPTE